MSSLAQELKGVIRSLVRSFLIAAEVAPYEEWPEGCPTDLPIANVELVKREASFVRMCLHSYFAKPRSKKDSLDRRIRNAVTLLVEADAQQNHAVGIALAVTAIEALLGAGKTEIAATLCDRVATLLEPDPEHRGAANDFMKKAYNDRSRVLHGEELDTAEQRRAEIRLLAAGVLFALVSYEGVRAQPLDEFFTDMRREKYSPGQPIGVPELLRVRNLWRKMGQKII